MTAQGRFCMRFYIAIIGALLAGTAAGSEVQGSDTLTAERTDVEAVHNSLRQVRDQIMESWQHRDIDAVLSHVDPNIVVTWQDGAVNRGPDAIRAFYKEMLVGEQSVLADIQSTLTVDTLSILHGSDTAIAYGSVHDNMTFRHPVGASLLGAGKMLALDSRWTATLVRKEGEWKLASYHVSANLFSNPVMDLVSKGAARVGGLIGFVSGAVVVLLFGWLLRRRRTSPASPP